MSNGASGMDRALVQFLGLVICSNAGRDRHNVQPDFPLSPFFLFAVLCFNRPWFSSLCLLMSAVEPTLEGTTQPERNTETTRITSDCLQWAIGEGRRTTHEMILLCPSLQAVGRCIPLCLVLGFATFVAFGNWY